MGWRACLLLFQLLLSHINIVAFVQLLPTSDQEMEQAAEAGQQQQQPPQGEQLAMEQAAMAMAGT